MKLSHLLLLVAGILLLFLLKPINEYFTPNPYVLSWQAPTLNGGDPDCCTYDWQICEDTKCEKIIDSGTTAKGVLSASTTKLDWNQSYTAQVRAVNKFGNGPWSSLLVGTGTATVAKVVAAASITGGVIVTPFNIGTSNRVDVWAGLTQGVGVYEGANQYLAQAKFTVQRDGKQIFAATFALTPSVLTGQAVFQGNPGLNTTWIPQLGDVYNTDVIIYNSKGVVAGEALASATVQGNDPSEPTGISLQYSIPAPQQ